VQLSENEDIRPLEVALDAAHSEARALAAGRRRRSSLVNRPLSETLSSSF
jgi:hypothetical protein